MSNVEPNILVEPEKASIAETQVSLLVPGRRPAVADRTGRAIVSDRESTRKMVHTRARRGLSLTCMGLAWADLSHVDMPGVDLSHSDLFQADLSEADLLQADLTGCDLRGARLNRANLLGAILVGADLTGADLTAATLTAATWDDTTRWPRGYQPPAPMPRLAVGDEG